MFLLQVLPWLGPALGGATGQGYMETDARISRPKPESLCLEVLVGPLLLTLACKWTAQPGTECVCVWGGGACVWVASCSIRPQTLHPTQTKRQRRAVWCSGDCSGRSQTTQTVPGTAPCLHFLTCKIKINEW